MTPTHQTVETESNFSRVFVLRFGTIVLCSSLAFAAPAEASDPWVEQVSANYRIQLAGVKFGFYTFTSSSSQNRYKVQSAAKLRAFFGAFRWRGSASSTGRITARGPVPGSYVYSYRKNKKAQKSLTMTMAGGDAIDIAHTPPRGRSKKRVPITEEHYEDILDPMSALVALSTPRPGAHPCKQTVRVLDGLHRFDVKLTPKGTRRLDTRTRRGFSRRVFVCRVEPRAIAGHKRGKSFNYISDPKGFEVWLTSANDGLIYIPYRIVVPTILGQAVLQATELRVGLSNKTELALAN